MMSASSAISPARPTPRRACETGRRPNRRFRRRLAIRGSVGKRVTLIIAQGGAWLGARTGERRLFVRSGPPAIISVTPFPRDGPAAEHVDQRHRRDAVPHAADEDHV